MSRAATITWCCRPIALTDMYQFCAKCRYAALLKVSHTASPAGSFSWKASAVVTSPKPCTAWSSALRPAWSSTLRTASSDDSALPTPRPGRQPSGSFTTAEAAEAAVAEAAVAAFAAVDAAVLAAATAAEVAASRTRAMRAAIALRKPCS